MREVDPRPHFKAKPERQDGFHTRKIIVADEVDIQEDAAGADFRTDLPTDI